MTENKLPTDRTIFFSDAVFAIAMTLLILEIKLPSLEELDTMTMGTILGKRIPNLIGFSVSFFVTALFWRSHLQICALVKKVDDRFFWLNIWLLFFVVLMPFTTALYSNYGFLDNVAFGTYCLNIALIGFFNYWMYVHVLKSEGLLESMTKQALRWKKLRTLSVPFIFLLCIAIAQLSIPVSRYGFIMIFIFQAIGDRVYKRKLKTSTAES